MNFSKNKKRVIKWENVITLAYVTITLFKYFITPNKFDIILFYDLTMDTLLGIVIHNIIYAIRKENA